MNLESCCSPCVEVAPIAIPGPQGPAGADGAPGVDAFAILAANMIVPPDTTTPVTITVNDSEWVVVGQRLIIGQGVGSTLTNPGPASFIVDAVPSIASITLLWLDLPGDVAAGTQIDIGAVVSPAGSQPASPLPVVDGGTGAITATNARANLGILGTPLSIYTFNGPAYALTATPAVLNVGAQNLSLVISSPGVWALYAQARVDYAGATFAASREVTFKLRRTNNTAADIANSSVGFATEIITTLTYTAELVSVPPIIYSTSNSDDIIQLWGSIAVIPTAGAINVVEASVVAIRLYDPTI